MGVRQSGVRDVRAFAGASCGWGAIGPDLPPAAICQNDLSKIYVI